jgi:hypothetical protein
MKHIIIIVSVFLCSCSFIQKGNSDKQSLSRDSVAYVEIQQKSIDSTFFRLTEKQLAGFIEKWNGSKELERCKFVPDFHIIVHSKNGQTRDFVTNMFRIKENSDYCFTISDSTYFGKLWAEAYLYTLMNAFEKVTKEKFLEQVKKLENGLKIEVVDLYEDTENISDYEKLYISDYLKKKGFEVTNYGRGNWFLGPIIESETLESNDFKCKVDKLYYTQDSTKKYKITERIECIKK